MPGATPTYGFPYPLGGDPLGDGENAIQELAEALEEFFTPWTSYTPAFGGFTSLGTGAVLHGKYRRTGDVVEFKIDLTLGTGGNVASNIIVSYPPAGLDPVDEYEGSPNHLVGYAHAEDVSTPQNYVGVLFADGSLWFDRTGSDTADADSPFDWDTGDRLAVSGSYQVAP
jgi:hypothetical protein